MPVTLLCLRCREFAMMDTSDRHCANWMEPIIKGDVPEARKAAAAAASGNKIVMFGGVIADSRGENATAELVIMEVTGPNSIHTAVNPPTHGASGAPQARSGATLTEYGAGKLFLYGGMDTFSKPLNDGWLLDVATLTWELVYLGASDAVLPTGSVGALHRGKLVVLNSNAGSPKLDIIASLDVMEHRDSLSFTPKMRVAAEQQLKALEEWVDAQGHGMELARSPDKLAKDFEHGLRRVMDALFQVKSQKAATDLLIDQLHEAFSQLQKDKVGSWGCGRMGGRAHSKNITTINFHFCKPQKKFGR